MKKQLLSGGIVPFLLIVTFFACQKRIDQASGFQEELSGRKTTTTNSTGQGIMIDFDVKGDYAVSGDKTYEFTDASYEVAATFFTHGNGVADTGTYTKNNGQDAVGNWTSLGATLPSEYYIYFNNSEPTTSQKYQASGGCMPPKPTTPDAPANDASQLTNVIDANKCIFLNGGTLTGNNYTKQSASIPSSCDYVYTIEYLTNYKIQGQNQPVGWYKKTGTTAGTWKWIYTYTISVNEPTNAIPAYTAWKLVGENYNGVNIPVKAKIAGLSAKTWSGNGRKYSFSLSYLSASGVDTTRISGLQVQLVDASGNVVVSQDAPHNIGTNFDVLTGTVPTLPGQDGALDFMYYTNGGTNGDVSLLPNTGPLTGPYTPVDARTLLNGDAFAGNNNGGAGGSALQIAVMPNQNLLVPGSTPAGTYKIRIVCNVKGNDGTVDQSTSVSQDIRIIANCNR